MREKKKIYTEYKLMKVKQKVLIENTDKKVKQFKIKKFLEKENTTMTTKSQVSFFVILQCLCFSLSLIFQYGAGARLYSTV